MESFVDEEAAVEFAEFLCTLGAPVFHDHWQDIPFVYIFDKPPLAVQYVTETEEIGSYSNPKINALGAHIAQITQEQSIGFFRIHAVDWVRRKTAVENWLRHKLGRNEKVCAARNAELATVPPSVASAFYEHYHLQGKSPGHHFGLAYEGYLVACMTFNRYVTNRGGCLQKHSFNLSRFALAGHVPGAASRLFKFACASLEAQEVVTFSDRTYAKGEVYQLLGFQPDGFHSPDYRVWHPKLGLSHKAHWQRNLLHARLKELGMEEKYDHQTDSRTEFQMCRYLGCRHVWDLGKIRWVWRRP